MKNYFRKYQVQQRLHSQKESSSPRQGNTPEVEGEKKELFESKFANLVFHLEDSMMELNWKGFVDSENYTNILEETLSAAIEKGVKKIIFNATHLEAITDENRTWTYDYWFLKVKENEIVSFAFILPNDIFGEVSLKMIADKVKEQHKIKCEFFENSEQALNWIREI